jgi:Protein of unknown function (DUF3048) N-terminal domain/Protein of unknown function (DUF3048) C-terminal domain
MDNQFKGHETEHTKSQPFKTPDQAAASDNEPIAAPILHSNGAVVSKPAKKKRKFKLKLWPPNKYTWITAGVVVVLLASGSYFLLSGSKPVKKAPPIIKKPVVVAPTTVASTLTGLQVSPATNNLPITAVMVENSTQARPQSGLGEAGVVFEALAEGGITRFVALFQSNDSTSIGPVRSARPYFISWILGFDAAYAHVGGSPEALSDISSWGVHNLDEFYNASSYQRISSRAAPHNVYTNPGELYSLEQSKGYTSSTFTSWTRKAAKPLKTPTATTVAMDLSSSDYNVSYSYDATTNSYNRNDGGAPETDADTNKQVSPPVVIAMVVPESNGPLDGIGAYYSEYATIGTGAAYVFQDGGVTVGQWSKAANTSQVLFTTSSGQPLALDPGEVWITAISSSSAVSYQ